MKYVNVFSQKQGLSYPTTNTLKESANKTVSIAHDFTYMSYMAVYERARQEIINHANLNSGIIYNMLYKYIPTASKKVIQGISNDMPNELALLSQSGINVTDALAHTIGQLTYYYSQLLDGSTNLNVFIEGNINIFSVYVIYILSKIGHNISVIDNDIDNQKYTWYNNFKFINQTSMERIGQYMSDNCLAIDSEITLDSVIDIMTGSAEAKPGLIHIIGEDIACKLVETLGTIKHNTPSNMLLLEYGMPKPSYDEVNAVPRLQTSSVEQLIKRINWNMFARNQTYSDNAVEFIKADLAAQQLTNLGKAQNKLVAFICMYNRYDLSKQVYLCYGALDISASTFAKFLALCGKTVIVVDVSDNNKKGNGVNNIDGIWNEIRLDTIVENHPYPETLMQGTIAFGASKEMDKLLYTGDTVGLYRTRQYGTCNVVTLHTTFDELRILWNKDVTVRQSFESNQSNVTVPVFYSRIIGWTEEYLDILSELNTEHTIVAFKPSELMLEVTGQMKINHLADINGTSFKDQKPMYKDNRLNVGTVMEYKTFTYRMLSPDVQRHILSKINQLINEKWIIHDGMSDEEFTDLTLNVALNLSQRFQQEWQWHDFTKQNPKLIVLCQDMEEITMEESIIITLMHLCGWDVILTIPTGYNVTGHNIRIGDMQEHIIGENKFNLGITVIPAYIQQNKQEKKKGFFSRLFK